MKGEEFPKENSSGQATEQLKIYIHNMPMNLGQDHVLREMRQYKIIRTGPPYPALPGDGYIYIYKKKLKQARDDLIN